MEDKTGQNVCLNTEFFYEIYDNNSILIFYIIILWYNIEYSINILQWCSISVYFLLERYFSASFTSGFFVAIIPFF